MATNHNTKILIVDDEIDFLEGMVAKFEKRYRVQSATSGKKALDILGAGSSDTVILSDQRMPGMTGLEFFDEVKKHNIENVGRILFTGYHETELALDAFNRGLILNYVEKPMTEEKVNLLYNYIDQAVENAEYEKWLERKVTGLQRAGRHVTLGRLADSVIDFFRETVHSQFQHHNRMEQVAGELSTFVTYQGSQMEPKGRKLATDLTKALSSNQETLGLMKGFFDNVRGFEMMEARDTEGYPLHDILLSAVASVKTLTINKTIVVRTRFDSKKHFMRCIPSDLFQVFVNLLLRAATVSKEAEVIHVETADRNGKVVITVEDGTGAPADQDPSQYLQGKIESDSFDLSSVPQIIEKYTGVVRSERSAKGSGFRVTVELPAGRDAS